MLKYLDAVFDKTPPLKKPIQAYRGIEGEFINNILSYISTSHQISVAQEFIPGDCCLLKILILPGSKVLPITSLSLADFEEEILLPRQGSFIINYVDTTQTSKTYDLTYLPPHVIPLNEPPKSQGKTFNRQDLINPEEVDLLGPQETVISLITSLNLDLSDDIVEEIISRIT